MIKSIGVDMESGRIIMLTKQKSAMGMNTKIVHKFKMYDEATKTIIYEIPLTNLELIGRLKSGLFTFVGDHLYFDDDVIKIRSDLIQSIESKTYREN